MARIVHTAADEIDLEGVIRLNGVPIVLGVAATRIVSSAGDGTDLTIQSAFDNLPAEGGYVYVKPGTYAPAVFPDKDVVLRGSGWGTKILVPGAGAALEVPDGLTAVRQYVVEDIGLVGTGVPLQAGIEIEDTHARGVVVLQRVKTEGIQIPISVSAGDIGFTRPVLIYVKDSWFRPLADGSSVLCSSNGNTELIFAHFSRVLFMEDPNSSIGGTLNGATFGNIDYVFEDSILSITGDDGFASLRAKNTWIFNNDSTVLRTLDMFGNFVMSDPWPSVLDSCIVSNLKLSPGDGMIMTGGTLKNCEVHVGGFSTSISVFHGVRVILDGSFLGNYAFILDLPAKISECRFAASGGAIPAAYIFVTGGNSRIEGNTFGSLTVSSTAAIRLGNPTGSAGQDNRVYGNTFDPGFGCPPILEFASAERNLYFGNIGYQTSSFQPGSTVEGSRRIEKTQATTSSFVAMANEYNLNGVNFFGSVVNIGSHPMDVSEYVVDLFGTIGSKITTVPAGGTLVLSSNQTVGAGKPPYKQYEISVKSTGVSSTTASLKATARTPTIG